MSLPTERAYDLAFARGCENSNECWMDCVDAAQWSINEGLDESDRALLAEYDSRPEA